jgi:Chloramphenicol phosphotransferase-like protein
MSTETLMRSSAAVRVPDLYLQSGLLIRRFGVRVPRGPPSSLRVGVIDTHRNAMPQRIVLLNGTSSAGETTVARALQRHLETPMALFRSRSVHRDVSVPSTTLEVFDRRHTDFVDGSRWGAHGRAGSDRRPGRGPGRCCSVRIRRWSGTCSGRGRDSVGRSQSAVSAPGWFSAHTVRA